MKKVILSLFAALPLLCSAQTTIDQRVEEVLSKMTLKDKIGQLNQLDGRRDVEQIKKEVREGTLSSIMNIVDPAVTNELQRIAMEESAAGIPILFARDVVHGFNTVLPSPLGMAASWDDQLIEAAARNTALEATEKGIRWAFAPMMDIARDARWGRIAESFGEVWLVWGDYTPDLPKIVELCEPDVVIYECAERVDRSYAVCDLAQALQNAG